MTTVDLPRLLTSLAQEAVAGQVFPGAVIGYVRGAERTIVAHGRLSYEATAPEVSVDTLYDVASITKSIPTSSLLLKYIEDGRLSLDDQVIQYLPELDNPYREQVLVRHLLTYTVIYDLPGGLAALAKTAPPGTLVTRLLTTPLLAPPGERYYYTNGPAILLGLIAEQVGGKPLDQLAQEMFFAPLAMDHSTFSPTQLAGSQVAPTEVVEGRGEVRGEPHDETTWALRQAEQVAGNAGLFSTAGDLLTFAQMLLADGEWDGRRYFKPETIRSMHTNQLGTIGAATGLGWEIERPEVRGTAGSNQLFMKTGFTGCLVAIDPVQQTALVHLSNRTYPKRGEREPIRAFWRELTALIFD